MSQPAFILKSLIFLLLAAASANGTVWQRHVQSEKGDSFDTPEPHPLAYFIQDPFLRDDGGDFCGDCTPQGKASAHTQHRYKTEVKKVGTLHGFAIYDVFYRFDDHVNTGEIDWKSILVEIAPERYIEIYHLQPIAAMVKPSFLSKAGPDEILATSNLIPGTGNNYYEDYFWFFSGGAVRIDIESIAKAVRSILPEGFGVWKGGGLDMGSLSYHTLVWKKGDSNCCPSGGSVDIEFRLDRGRIVITGKHFDPSTGPVD